VACSITNQNYTITIMSNNNRKTNTKRNRNKQKKNNQQMSLTRPLWAHDQAMLNQSFPDTQVWNVLSEHDPRYGASNSRDNKIFNVVQTAIQTQVVTSSTTVTNNAPVGFFINDLSQVSSLTAVFDQYRIMQVEIWLRPSNVTGPGIQGQVYTVIDYDDNNAITNPVNYSQYANCTITQPHEGVYRRFRPHQAINTFGSSAFGSFTNAISQWNDSASTTVGHYGFKIATTIMSQSVSYDIVKRYWVQFRNVF